MYVYLFGLIRFLFSFLGDFTIGNGTFFALDYVDKGCLFWILETTVSGFLWCRRGRFSRFVLQIRIYSAVGIWIVELGGLCGTKTYLFLLFLWLKILLYYHLFRLFFKPPLYHWFIKPIFLQFDIFYRLLLLFQSVHHVNLLGLVQCVVLLVQMCTFFLVLTLIYQVFGFESSNAFLNYILILLHQSEFRIAFRIYRYFHLIQFVQVVGMLWHQITMLWIFRYQWLLIWIIYLKATFVLVHVILNKI